MKIIAIFCLLLTAAQTAKSQVSGQTVYTIKAKELWQRPNGSSDTIDVPVLNFIAKLDSTGNAADSVLISVKKIVSGNTDTLAGLVAGKELTLASNTPLTMEFILARLVPQNETIKKPKMKLYFGVNDSFKMILSEKVAEEMIALNKAGTPASRFEAKDDSLITSVHTIRVTDKTIRVVFLHRGELQTDAQKQNEEVKSMLKKLLAGSGSRQAIGWFTLRKNPVPVYEAIGKSSKPYSKGPFPIQSVDIMLENGTIRKKGIRVRLLSEDSLVFRNQEAPITVYGLRHRIESRLYVENDTHRLFVRPADLFYYDFKGKFHYPDDELSSLSPDHTVDSIYNFTEFNDVIDVTLFSDLLSLLGRKPNGIIQTQLSGKFIINTKNLFGRKDIILFNFFKPYFRLSKFDSRYAQIDTTILKDSSITNKLFLSQVSYLQAGIKQNIFRIGVGANQELLLNAGMDINLTSADSLLKKDISFVNYYPEIEYHIQGMENFGVDLSCKWIRQEYSKNSPFNNRKAIWIFNPQVTAYYSPFSNKSSKIYIKFANFAEIHSGKYNFTQFQLGVKTNLFKKE